MVDCRHRDVERGDTRFSLCREISLDNLEAKERVGPQQEESRVRRSRTDILLAVADMHEERRQYPDVYCTGVKSLTPSAVPQSQ